MFDPLNQYELPPDDLTCAAEEIRPEAEACEPCASAIVPLPKPIPIPKPIFPKNSVSGRYRGTVGSFQLELRIDIDGNRPCNLASGDFYQLSGAVKSYFGSLKSGPLAVTWSSASVTISGTVSTTWSTAYKVITITIPRTSIFAARAAATITFSTSGGATGGTYVCAFESVHFRTISLEMDYENGTALFGSYDTATLPHGGSARVLDTVSAYAEAGVQMVKTAGTDIVPTADAGSNAIWTNAELEASMHQHFSSVVDSPQWQTYLLACESKHEMTSGGSTLFGIMFDYSGTSQRQGCAVFQSQINSYYGGAGSNDANRHTLYCYVHEIGHSFNLLHSWDKGRANSLSWMNYDWKYDQANGAGSYWANFAFQFDDLELVHIRHDYRSSVIMGGDNWATNSGLGTGEARLDITRAMIENRSGLELELSAKTAFSMGEPVVVGLKLKLRDLNGKAVNARLHPNFDFTRVAIKKPNGAIVTYEPLAEHLCRPNMVNLTSGNPSISESAYIGYGKDGFYFDQPGTYILKAAYHTAEGDIITSADVRIRIKSPLSVEEDAIADLYLGEEQGRLFYLLGSDAAHLQKGNDAFSTVLQQYAAHPLSVYAALVQGVNAARDFKMIGADKKITVRKQDPKRSNELIEKVFKMTSKGQGVDTITLSYAMRRAAASQISSGDKAAAKKTMDSLKLFAGKQNLATHELNLLNMQIDRVLKP